ncbi:MAG: ribonuclease R, partial [Planctomycetota bacterium]
MQISRDLADRVLRHVNHPDYRPAKPKVIANAMNLDADEYRELRRVVKQLVLEGQLVYASNHLVMGVNMATGNPDIVRGTFRRAHGGFGFVRPGDGGGDIEDMPDDIFV